MADTEEDEIRTVTVSRWASSRVASVLSVGLFINLTLVYLLTGGGQEILHRSVPIFAYFDDGTGLVRTADVLLDGINVGEVKSVKLNDTSDASRAVEVRMNIRNDYLKDIPVDSQTEITADNLVGDKYINIKRGRSKSSVVSGAELKRVPPEPDFDPADLIRSLNTSLRRTRDLLDRLENPATPLGGLVKTEDLYFKFRDDIKGFEDSVAEYGSPKSPVGKAIYDQELYNRIRKPLLDLDKQLADIENNSLLKDSSQYDNALAKIHQFRGSVKQVIDAPTMASDEQYQNTVKKLSDFSATFDELTRGQGQMAQLLSSPQLYEQFAGASREARTFLHDFRLDPQKYLRIKVF